MAAAAAAVDAEVALFRSEFERHALDSFAAVFGAELASSHFRLGPRSLPPPTFIAPPVLATPPQVTRRHVGTSTDGHAAFRAPEPRVSSVGVASPAHVAHPAPSTRRTDAPSPRRAYTGVDLPVDSREGSRGDSWSAADKPAGLSPPSRPKPAAIIVTQSPARDKRHPPDDAGRAEAPIHPGASGLTIAAPPESPVVALPPARVGIDEQFAPAPEGGALGVPVEPAERPLALSRGISSPPQVSRHSTHLSVDDAVLRSQPSSPSARSSSRSPKAFWVPLSRGASGSARPSRGASERHSRSGSKSEGGSWRLPRTPRLSRSPRADSTASAGGDAVPEPPKSPVARAVKFVRTHVSKLGSEPQPPRIDPSMIDRSRLRRTGGVKLRGSKQAEVSRRFSTQARSEIDAPVDERPHERVPELVEHWRKVKDIVTLPSPSPASTPRGSVPPTRVASTLSG